MRQSDLVTSIAVTLFTLGVWSEAMAADAAAGKARATACMACHGSNGISVSATIPNLAGQKAKYIENQLNAFRAKRRKNPLMNAVASQLSDGDIGNLAAFFSGLPGAAATSNSKKLAPALEASNIRFPAALQSAFHPLHDDQLRQAKAGPPLLCEPGRARGCPRRQAAAEWVFPAGGDLQGQARWQQEAGDGAGRLHRGRQARGLYRNGETCWLG